ncbi:hypothetical protein Tco_0371326 [Tanacetum coccineum]
MPLGTLRKEVPMSSTSHFSYVAQWHPFPVSCYFCLPTHYYKGEQPVSNTQELGEITNSSTMNKPDFTNELVCLPRVNSARARTSCMLTLASQLYLAQQAKLDKQRLAKSGSGNKRFKEW